MDCKTFTKLWLNSKTDELPQEAREHLAHCAECQHKVDCYTETLDLLKSAPKQQINVPEVEFAVMSRIENMSPAAQHSSHRKLWIASAAASVAVLLGASQYIYQQNAEQEENEAIVEMISKIHDENRGPREQNSAYNDLAVLEMMLTDVKN